MQCTQCGSSNPPGTSVCAQCSTPLPLDDRPIEDSISDADSICDVDQTLTHGWSQPSAPIHHTVSPEQFRPGRMLGNRYQILQLLGEGGMGAVYKARDRELDRLVALKIIRPNLAMSSEILHRFKQELILARQVTHRNVIRIFDLGEADGVKFITMEYIDGETLRTILLREGKLTPVEASKIIQQVCRGLEAAHAEGVIHRDLKPQNIMRDAQHRIVVMDFGVAHLADAAEIRPPRPPSGDVSTKQAQPFYSQTGVLVGTPAYMAPEQALGQETDARSDIFALGIIFFELLTGKLPFQADTHDVLLKRTREKAKAVHEIEPKVPRSLSKIVERCLEPLREFRYQTATEVRTHLDAWLAPAWRKAGKWIAASAAVLLLVGTQIVVQRTHRTPIQHPPVSVLVADFKNDTGDPVFDGTLEPMFNVALEGASFINAYNRGTARKLAHKLPNPTDKLDEQQARLIATREGINTVIGGSIARQGRSYRVVVRAVDAVTGNVITQTQGNAANKDDVLRQLAKLAAPIRKALGDKTTESAQLERAGGAFTAASLEVAHQYGIAMEQQFSGKVEEAFRSFAKAAELDPNFARAYSGMASAALKLDRMQDADKYIKLAMEHVDRMTDRERYRVRGFYYLTTGNWQKCTEEYNELVSRYPGDNIAHNNLAVCSGQLRNLPKAVEEARSALATNPTSSAAANLSLLLSYDGDFQSGENEAHRVQQSYPSFEYGYLALAFAQLGQGQLSQVSDTYQKLKTVSALGASKAASGLADLALYEGRFADAARILEKGTEADLTAKKPDAAADKYVALAYTELSMRQNRLALTAGEKALANSRAVKTRLLAGQVFAEVGEVAKAQKVAAGLASELQSEPQAYAKIIDGTSALKRGEARAAIKALKEANDLQDTWIGHFQLARAYLEAGLFVEADSEFDRCIKRRGEALSLFLDQVPTFGHFPPVYYYQGRVREGLKSSGFADSYRTYLTIRGQAGEDPLLPEIHRRLGEPGSIKSR